MHSGWGATCTADPLQTLHANVNDRVLFVLASLQTKPNDDGASMVESTDAQIDWVLGKPSQHHRQEPGGLPEDSVSC